jgi:hypothetical protein
MDLKLDANSMQAIVAKAILEGMSEEQRAAILTKAIEALMVERANPNSYQDRTTVIEDAFNRAAREAVYALAREKFKEPALVARLGEVLEGAIKKVFEPDSDGAEPLTAILAKAMTQGLREHAGMR